MADINALYRQAYNRDATAQEISDWNAWSQRYPNQSVIAAFSAAAGRDKSITNTWMDLFGRGPTSEEMTGWQGSNYSGADIAGAIRNAAASNPASKNYQASTGMAPWEKNIRDLYGSMIPDIEAGVKSAASQRGGMETGGYLTAMGKARASTWQDMMKAIIGQQNIETARADKTADWANQRNLALEIADLSKPTDWEKFLQLINAGANVADAFIPG